MCGIFAYMGNARIPIADVLKVLHILETEQEPDEKTPVGIHGAGIAHLNQKGRLILTKVGKTNTALPVNDLQLQLKETISNFSHLILSHVRRASPEFQNTIAYKECTQPYQPNCLHNKDFAVLTAHNGYLQNYQQLKNQLTQPHQLESQRHTLVDSEVIAHLTEEILTKTRDPTKTTHTLIEQIKGNNTIAILYYNKHENEAHIHAIQHGKTRGLIAWINPKSEVLLCSREQPVEKILTQFLTENNFQKTIKVTRNDSINLQAHFNLQMPPQNR